MQVVVNIINKMTKRNTVIILLIALSTIVPTAVISNGSALSIDDYEKVIVFSGEKIVRIQKGDDAEYARPSFDDSNWRVISLPSDWTAVFPKWEGICWYRIHVRFPSRLPAHSLGIQLGIISDVDELYFNGIKIASSGSFPPNRKSCYDKIRVYEIPTILIRPGADNVFALRVASLFPAPSGPYTGDFLFGPFMQLQRNLLSREFFSMFFVAIYLAVSIYFGIIFFLHAVDKDNLMFSLATLLSALYFFFRTQVKYLISDNFLLMKKIEYIVLFVIFSAFVEFITYYTVRKRSKLHYAFHAVTFIGVVAVLISNNPIIWNTVLKNVIQPTWAFPVVYSFYVIAINLRSRRDYAFLFIAFIILTITLVNDILVNRAVYNFISLSGYAYLFLIIGIAYIMHRRFVELKKRLENSEIDMQKAELSKKLRIGTETEEKLKIGLSIIEQKFAEDITRESLADEVGMNADYFGKLFKQYTGKKIGEYLNEVRVRKAQELLGDPDNSIASIAFAVGFESLPTFYRVFQKCTGESPQGYRKKICGGKKPE